MALTQSGGPLAFLGDVKLGNFSPKEVKERLDKWVLTQPPWVEAAAATTYGGFQGAFLGSMMGYMGQMSADTAGAAGGPQMSMMMKGSPLVQARNFAVMTGVNTGVSALMRRVRGVEDIQNSLVAAFTSGACFSLVSGGLSAPPPVPGAAAPNPLMGAFSAGVVFALFQGCFYKLGEKFSGPKVADENQFAKVKAMLTSLGLAKYEKNLKKGLMDDQTIMLWDSSALQECRVPPGPRLLILHHIDTYRHLLKPGMPIPSGAK